MESRHSMPALCECSPTIRSAGLLCQWIFTAVADASMDAFAIHYSLILRAATIYDASIIFRPPSSRITSADALASA